MPVLASRARLKEVQREQMSRGDNRGANVELSPKGDDKNVAFMRMTRQSSLPFKEPTTGLSLEKLRSFAAARPYSPVTPSRFAQAVRLSLLSRLFHTSFSPIRNRSSVIESERLSEIKDGEKGDVEGDKDSPLQVAEGEPTSFGRVCSNGRREQSIAVPSFFDNTSTEELS
ncbi:hypothetical protein F7725_001913 [Dissostichus mawsoni]|uniref:Uncharacterized protein n=1 Tax=Dissostichus mawsoni TaxID=36200 RepID=A0A7J5Y0X1_DISMA|nr:hypothetical protein F7725_001913 [Dissostichus mawsoni]